MKNTQVVYIESMIKKIIIGDGVILIRTHQ